MTPAKWRSFCLLLNALNRKYLEGLWSYWLVCILNSIKTAESQFRHQYWSVLKNLQNYLDNFLYNSRHANIVCLRLGYAYVIKNSDVVAHPCSVQRGFSCIICGLLNRITEIDEWFVFSIIVEYWVARICSYIYIVILCQYSNWSMLNFVLVSIFSVSIRGPACRYRCGWHKRMASPSRLQFGFGE